MGTEILKDNSVRFWSNSKQ